MVQDQYRLMSPSLCLPPSIPRIRKTFNSSAHVGDLRLAHGKTIDGGKTRYIYWKPLTRKFILRSPPIIPERNLIHIFFVCLFVTHSLAFSQSLLNWSAAARSRRCEWKRAAWKKQVEGTYQCVILRGANVYTRSHRYSRTPRGASAANGLVRCLVLTP